LSKQIAAQNFCRRFPPSPRKRIPTLAQLSRDLTQELASSRAPVRPVWSLPRLLSGRRAGRSSSPVQGSAGPGVARRHTWPASLALSECFAGSGDKRQIFLARQRPLPLPRRAQICKAMRLNHPAQFQDFEIRVPGDFSNASTALGCKISSSLSNNFGNLRFLWATAYCPAARTGTSR